MLVKLIAGLLRLPVCSSSVTTPQNTKGSLHSADADPVAVAVTVRRPSADAAHEVRTCFETSLQTQRQLKMIESPRRRWHKKTRVENVVSRQEARNGGGS